MASGKIKRSSIQPPSQMQKAEKMQSPAVKVHNTRTQACHDQSISGPHPISADHGAAPPTRCSEARSPYSWASESRSVLSNSLRPHGLYSPWNSPGQNTGVGSLSLLQGGLDLLAVQGTLKSLLQHHTSKASILRHLALNEGNRHKRAEVEIKEHNAEVK